MKEKLMNRLKNNKGFTLVEMIVVIAIIAILIALLAPNVAALINDTNETSDQARAKNIYNTVSAYATKQVKDELVVGPASALAMPSNSTASNDMAVVELTDAAANTNIKAIWTTDGSTAATGLDDIVGDGDTYLPSNTFSGGRKAYALITSKGAVQGVILVDSNGKVTGYAGSAYLGSTDWDSRLIGKTAALASGVLTIS